METASSQSSSHADRFRRGGVWCLMGLGLAVPLSTALSSAVLPLAALAAWLMAGGVFRLPALVRSSPVAWSALMLFLWLGVSVLYSSADWGSAVGSLNKYRDLLFIPVFMVLLSKARDRRKVHLALIAGLVASMIVSYAQWFGWLPLNRGFPAPSSTITHSTFMVWLFFCLLWEVRVSGYSWLCYSGAALAVLNILFLGSTTGYVLILAMGVLFAWQERGSRRIIPLLAAFVCLVAAGWFLIPEFKGELSQNIHEANTLDASKAGTGGLDKRVAFLSYTAEIVSEALLLGHGMGSFEGEYSQAVSGSGHPPTTNPHNEFALTWAQAGVVGLGLLMSLLHAAWRTSALQSAPVNYMGRGFILIFTVGCLFNSFLLDTKEGILFALALALYCPESKAGKLKKTSS